MKMNNNIIVKIDNSNDLLSQKQWASFINKIKDAFDVHCLKIQFFGTSMPNSSKQSSAIIAELNQDFNMTLFVKDIQNLAIEFNQDFIPVIIGELNLVNKDDNYG